MDIVLQGIIAWKSEKGFILVENSNLYMSVDKDKIRVGQKVTIILEQREKRKAEKAIMEKESKLL